MTKHILLLTGLILLSATTPWVMAQKRKIERAATITALTPRVVIEDAPLGQRLEAGQMTTDGLAQNEKLVRVSFSLVVPKKAVRRNFRYTISPILIGRDSSFIELTPISPVGPGKGRAEHRNAVLGHRAKSYNRLITTKSNVGNGIQYSIAVPYQGWMSGQPLELVLSKRMRGYHKGKAVDSQSILTDIEIVAPYKRLVAPLTPQAKNENLPCWMKESVEYQAVQDNLLMPPVDGLRVNFARGSKRFRPHFQGNKHVLRELSNTLSGIDTTLISIDRLRIQGHAVSDGDKLLQSNLEEHRAQGLKKRIDKKENLDSRILKEVVSTPQVWASLRRHIAYSALNKNPKKHLINMIDATTNNTDALERQIMLTDNGSAYWYVKDHLLPGLTDAAYLTVYYSDAAQPANPYINRSIEMINMGNYSGVADLLATAPADLRIANLVGYSTLLENQDAIKHLNGKLNFVPIGQQYAIEISKVSQADNTMVAPSNPYIADYGEYEADSKRLTFQRDSATLSVLYDLSESELKREAYGNARALDTFMGVIENMKHNNDLKIKKIRIVGQASPEGNHQFNERLALARAHALKDYICKNDDISPELFDIVSIGPAWNELRDMVASDTMINDKASVLEILDNPAYTNNRQARLAKLHWGKDYRYMKEKLFPRLRNATYFKLYFQMDPYTNYNTINRAIDMIKEGQYQGAIELLGTVKDDPNAALPLGVALTMAQGSTEQGQEYLQKAAKMTDKTAKN